MFQTHPGLRKLARLKLRGHLRALRRRLSTASGIVFGLLGLLFVGLWIASLAYGNSLAVGRASPADGVAVARGALGLLCLMTVIGSLSYRGLYLPRDEVERLLSAPVSRSDLIRYRLLVNAARSSLFALIMALVASRRMPSRFAFAGTLVAMLLLPVLGQATAILFGGAETRVGAWMKRVPAGLLRAVAGVIAGVTMGGFLWIGTTGGGPFAFEGDWMGKILYHPVFEALTAPFLPWAKAIAAPDLATFAPWFLLSTALLVVLFELTAQIPVDFRTLSLETSSDVARRLSRFRSGRNMVSGSAVSRRALGWRVPWLFGHGPFGAVAWLKLCALVRKARGTVLFSVFVLGFVTLVTSNEAFGEIAEPLPGAVLIAVMGTIYLCSGLRFDFRADLDLMATIKAWPLSSSAVFLATILPSSLLVALLIGIAIVVRACFLGAFPLAQWALIAFLPLLCLLWSALDNAVFLFAPVRFVPGQGDAMHHTGRTMVLLLLRMALLAVLALVSAGLFWVVTRLSELGGVNEGTAFAWAWIGVVLVFVAGVCALVAFGAWALRRFDVGSEHTIAG